jgi:hypothetical protein
MASGLAMPALLRNIADVFRACPVCREVVEASVLDLGGKLSPDWVAAPGGILDRLAGTLEGFIQSAADTLNLLFPVIAPAVRGTSPQPMPLETRIWATPPGSPLIVRIQAEWAPRQALLWLVSPSDDPRGEASLLFPRMTSTGAYDSCVMKPSTSVEIRFQEDQGSTAGPRRILAVVSDEHPLDDFLDEWLQGNRTADSLIRLLAMLPADTRQKVRIAWKDYRLESGTEPGTEW